MKITLSFTWHGPCWVNDSVIFIVRSSVVSLSVCLLVTFVNPTKTAEPIEVPFGAGAIRISARNHY